MVLLGHADGGDYWNWFNSCHPERVAMVFVHASGGVNYSGADLEVPVMYELGTNDLIEQGSKMPRAGMFANRIARGATMSLVLAQGQSHEQPLSPESTKLVVTLIESIFRLRVPADADPALGPVQMNRIDEASGKYWLGDLYSKEIAPYPAYKGDRALTVFLPSEEVANLWKATGPPLPASIKLPTGDCGWCGHPKVEPRPTPVVVPPAVVATDAGPAGTVSGPADASASPPADGAASGGAGGAPSPSTGGQSGSAGGGTTTPSRGRAGGCAVAGGAGDISLAALAILAARGRRRLRLAR
jgi:hypothetical protein